MFRRRIRPPLQAREAQFHLDALTVVAREALARSGSAWTPGRDLTVRSAVGPALAVEYGTRADLIVSVNIAALITQCARAPAAGVGTLTWSAVQDAVAASVRLAAGYFDYCPWDGHRHQRLCDAAARSAFGADATAPSEQYIATLVADLFERSLISHVVTRQRDRKFPGGTLWAHRINNPPWGLVQGLFFRVQEFLDARWLEVQCGEMPSWPPLVEELAPRMLGIIFECRVKGRADRYRLQGRPDSALACGQWPRRVGRLAELLVPYLDNEGPPDAGNQLRGNPFGLCQMRAEPLPACGLEPSASAALSSAGGPGDAAPSPVVALSGGCGTEHRDARSFEHLDSYYTQRAAELVVRCDAVDGVTPARPQLLTVGYLDSEPAPPEALVSGELDWSRTRLVFADGQPRLQLYRRVDPLQMPLAREDQGHGHAPHLLLVVDSSGSMGFSPSAPSPCRGRYDLVLLACWGIFRHLSRVSVGRQVAVAAINFSGRSIASGWQRFPDIPAVKKTLLTYQGGGTVLEPSALLRAVETRPGSFLAVAITDGQIRNCPAALEAVRGLLAAGCHWTLLHVGAPNPFTEGVRALHCPVFILPDAQALVGLTLQIARHRYGR